MKKCLSILCVVAMLLGLMIPVSATGNHDIKVSASTHANVKPGDHIFVTIDISGIDDNDDDFRVNYLTFNVKYDTDVFDFGADINCDGKIEDVSSKRGTTCETIARALSANDPWSSMESWTPGLANYNGSLAVPFTATPKLNDEGILPVTFGTDNDKEYYCTNGSLMGFYLTVKENAMSGEYPIQLIKVDEEQPVLWYSKDSENIGEAGQISFDAKYDVTLVNGSITVQGSTPVTPTPKTATISSVTGGYVYATTTAWDGNTEIDLDTLATSVTTAGSAAEEKVFFYFVPKAGYTANITATKDGESFDIVKGSTSKEDTLTADATYTFAFEAVTAGTPVASSIEVSNASANGVTLFGKATNATEFGALVGLSDDVAANHGYMFAAEAANGDGQFAIVLEGTGMFDTAKSYAAKIYATNNGTTEYSSNTTAINFE